MRDTSSWYKKLAKQINPHWPTDTDIKPALLFQVELNLRLLERLDALAPPEGAYTLLGGYPFAAAAGIATGPEDTSMITAARLRLWKLRRRRTWLQSLEAYWQLPERLRRYREPGEGEPMRAVIPTILSDRHEHYDAQLATLPGFDVDAPEPAGPGQHRFIERRRPTSVTIPDEAIQPPAEPHDLTAIPVATHAPLTVALDELAGVAQWMDKEARSRGMKDGNWQGRLADLQLDVLAANGSEFVPSDTLTLDGLVHLVGMVGAGKSTLMTLIAVWAHKKKLRTTLIVGDVAEQLSLTAMLRRLGLSATPVLGGSTRERHAARLHRRLATKRPESLLAHDDPGFDDLSTACPLDALRGLEAARPLRYSDAPCAGLHPVKAAAPVMIGEIALPGPYLSAAQTGEPEENAEEELRGEANSCPLWSACPRHAPDRDMVDALIWIANPASLLHSPVPGQQNPQRLRRLELACLRSDIIIVDEADRVQMNLDTTFAPAATLVVRGPDSWLDRLHVHKIDTLALEGRMQLPERDVNRWNKALAAVGMSTDDIYAMLIADARLREWAEIEYFNAWTLQDKLLEAWYPQYKPADEPDGVQTETDAYESPRREDDDEQPAARIPGNEPWAGRRDELLAALDAFRDDPLGDRGPHPPITQELIGCTKELLQSLNEKGAHERLKALLRLLLDGSPLLTGELRQPQPGPGEERREPSETWGDPAWFERNAIHLRFTLLLSVLTHRLDRVTFLWPLVEAALHLDTSDNELLRRPPLDYAPIVPEAPMGNVIGFQYLPDDPPPIGSDRRTGTLRFFRCAGVGRELLLNLPVLGTDPAAGRRGPHVLLMSGTSWAGTSTRAHILTPVTAVLKPTDEAIDAIRRTKFRLRILKDGNTPLTLSGAKPDTRHPILRQMVTQLGKSAPGRPSILDQELLRIGDDHRRRALLLVGSYQEANIAADALEGIERWRGRVRVLAADDAALESPGALGDGLPHATALRRGDLASFAEDPDAEVLVAPLLAVERGHNILNTQRTAAFGVALFLARPHPRPDDLSLAVFAINDWATRFIRDLPGLDAGTFSKLVADAADLDAAGLAFRHLARKAWRRLLSRRYAYTRLNDQEKISFAWDQLVTIWQVIGRLVRGGVPAEVVFVDAAFAPEYAYRTAVAASQNTTARRRASRDPGLLIKLREILEPYFEPGSDPAGFAHPADPALVQALYRPLYDALRGIDFTIAPRESEPDFPRTYGASRARTL